jgi:hypothetical protein
LELPAQSPYILEMDREAIDHYDHAVHNDDEKTIVESIPTRLGAVKADSGGTIWHHKTQTK